MRSFGRGFLALAAGLVSFSAAASTAAEIEKPAALNGSQYTVVAPLYTESSGSLSYLRLFNGGTAATTFNITVVNADTGFTLGGAAVQVPKNAAPQYPMTSAAGGNSIFTQAGVSAQTGTKYALYIQDTDQYAGYEHVSFNGQSTLFENLSVCTTPINQQMAALNSQVVTNVHTSALASGGYPSTIVIHNFAATASTDKITVADAATGTTIGTFNQTIQNGVMSGSVNDSGITATISASTSACSS